MASSGAVVYVRPLVSGGATSIGASGAVVFMATRVSTGRYSSLVIGAGSTSRNRKVIRPDNSVPYMIQSGDGMTNNPAWSQWFQYIEQSFLDMLKGPTLPDVAQYVTVSEAQSIAANVVQHALAQQANANAQSILTIREVVQSAALPGAVQIPIPKLFVEFDASAGQ